MGDGRACGCTSRSALFSIAVLPGGQYLARPVEPVQVVSLGTRGLLEALDLLECCATATGSPPRASGSTGLSPAGPVRHSTPADPDRHAANASQQPGRVTPAQVTATRADDGRLSAMLPPLSWSTLRMPLVS
jgi:alpha-L-arabinofuranosidase